MFLSEAEVASLLARVRQSARASTGHQGASRRLDKLVIEALLFSGLRTSEFCQLRVGDTIIGHGESVFLVSGQESAGRTVHVPVRVSELVARFVRETRPRFLPDDIAPDDMAKPLVFNERRNPYERTGLYRRVKRILTAAGLGARASVQLLRHTYGYLAYRQTGGNLLFVQRQLGHAHPMVTSVYASLVDESYADMAGRVDIAGEKSAADATFAFSETGESR